jgi:signal transduction histidine kinase
MAVALLDMGAGGDFTCPGSWYAVVAALILPFRRRWPLPVFALTIPALISTDAQVAPVIALYALAATTRNRRLLIACAAVFVTASTIFFTSSRFADMEAGIFMVYTLATAAAPAFLGQLVQARADLKARIIEITEAREHERLLAAQNLLARERAQLAREMHDVVSHQVSLIAVHAGALQVRTTDPEIKQDAATIRRLSTQTLDELRHMVTVLRASGSRPTELTPQPTLAQLQELVTGSGLPATLELSVPDDLAPAVQRAIYRIVQEALTNVRKHAPGATATVTVHADNGTVSVTVANGPATRPVLALPSSQHGLIGLHQRTELLGGTTQSGSTPEGGYELRAHLPLNPT